MHACSMQRCLKHATDMGEQAGNVCLCWSMHIVLATAPARPCAEGSVSVSPFSVRIGSKLLRHCPFTISTGHRRQDCTSIRPHMLWRSYNSVALAQRSCALHRPAALAFAPDRSCCSVLESRQTVGTHSMCVSGSNAACGFPAVCSFFLTCSREVFACDAPVATRSGQLP